MAERGFRRFPLRCCTWTGGARIKLCEYNAHKRNQRKRWPGHAFGTFYTVVGDVATISTERDIIKRYNREIRGVNINPRIIGVVSYLFFRWFPLICWTWTGTGSAIIIKYNSLSTTYTKNQKERKKDLDTLLTLFISSSETLTLFQQTRYIGNRYDRGIRVNINPRIIRVVNRRFRPHCLRYRTRTRRGAWK